MTLVEAVVIRTKELLFKQNITQYRLIKESFLDKTTIQAILKNKTKDIKLSTVFAIASVFNMSLNDFFNANIFNREELEF